MNQLNKSALLDDAKSVFDLLAASPELKKFTMIGGTALALQINHRISLDFDFATFDDVLPVNPINELVNRLKQKGNGIRDITNISAVSQFKINTGNDLRDYARDYVINNVKLTFFCHGKNSQQREYYKKAGVIQATGVSFSVLGLSGLKIAKTLVLADRARSRDLFDLMILCKNYNYTIDQMISTVKQLGHIDDPEYYKAVMTGIIPLDRNDEGLDSVNVDLEIKQIYDFFDNTFAEYEIDKSADFFTKNKPT